MHSPYSFRAIFLRLELSRAELGRRLAGLVGLVGVLFPQVICADVIERYAADRQGWQLSGPVWTWPTDDLGVAVQAMAGG